MSVLAAIKKQVTLGDVLLGIAQQLPSAKKPNAMPRSSSSGSGSVPPNANTPVASSSQPVPPFPEMKGGEDHRLYALCVQAGMPHKEACIQAGVKRRTAHDWRSDLRRDVSAYLGREVEYEFAARFVMDPELRKLCFPDES